MDDAKYFDDIAEIGLPVYWYPGCMIDDTTIPVLGFVGQSWSRGVVDVTALPAQDGTVDVKLHVYHRGDPRLRDSFGRISEGGRERGCWEFTPLAKHYMECCSAPKKKAAAK